MLGKHATARAALDFVRLIARMDTDAHGAVAENGAAATLGELIATARALALADHRATDPHCTCPDCVRFHFDHLEE